MTLVTIIATSRSKTAPPAIAAGMMIVDRIEDSVDVVSVEVMVPSANLATLHFLKEMISSYLEA